MVSPIVFYSKCRPQGVDAWPIAKDHLVVFIGYPPWRSEKYKDAVSGFRDALYDIGTDLGCSARLDEDRGYRTQVAKNATLAREVSIGSYVIVPRLECGVCHIGKIASTFELVDAPPWASAYLHLREQVSKDFSPAGNYLADVVQCWRVEAWKERPFPLVPRWISYRLLSRNTAGVIVDIPEYSLNAHERIETLLRDPREAPPVMPVSDRAAIRRALIEWISPSSFEHLLVDLLQLDEKQPIYWHHVGGSGDGGVDGIAVDGEGDVVAVLQCKWHFAGNTQGLLTGLDRIRSRWPNCRVIVATLLGPQEVSGSQTGGGEILLLDDIVELVVRHAAKLPLAQSLGIMVG